MNKEFGFKITRLKQVAFHSMSEAHSHPFYEIYYLMSGDRRFYIDQDTYTLHKGDALLIQKENMHRSTYLLDKSHERYVINVTDQFLEPMFEHFSKEMIMSCFSDSYVSIPVSRREYVEDLLFKMECEYKMSDDFSVYLLRNHLYELLIFMLRCHRHQYESADQFIESDEIIQNVVKYICSHYHQGISLEDVAKQANMSATYFSRKFKKMTGFGFKEYLSSVRLRSAETLLLESKLSITEIALRCGFNDSNYFGDAFKKSRGMSPHQYRKNKGII